MPANPTAISVLFSSISSVVGNTGHANYAAANSALDAFAAHQTAAGMHTVSVQWGAWLSVGECYMQRCYNLQASNHAAGLRLTSYCSCRIPCIHLGMAHKQVRLGKTQYSQVGMVASETGLAALHYLMALTVSRVVPVIGIVPKAYWQSLLGNLSNLPGFYSDLHIRTPQNRSVKASPNEQMPVAYSTNQVSGRSVSPSQIEATVKQLVNDVLGTVAVSLHDPLANQGMDSLARLEIRQKIQVTCRGWYDKARIIQQVFTFLTPQRA